MKLRHPPRPAPKVPTTGQPSFIKSFNVELITPMYGGGVNAGHPDTEMPFRVSAIRGQLRFWWRLLKWESFRDHRVLFKEECAIFGGMANNNGAKGSRVIIWITDVSAKDPVPCATYKTENGKLKGPYWNGLPGYALFPGQGQPKEGKDPAKIICPPASFKLHVAIRGDDVSSIAIWTNDIKPSLRWWASFGGIGARTRRGLGSIKISDLEAVSQDEAQNVNGCRLISRNQSHSPQKAWDQAINKLKTFRQGAGDGRDHGTPPSPAGRSRWPEADSIREITGCHLLTTGKTHRPVHPARPSFPRAAFGLPIITQFKDGPKKDTEPAARRNLDPDQTVLYPVIGVERMDRMASPLILKAMWTGSGYAPIALLLPHPHVSTMAVNLEDNAGSGNMNLPYSMAAGSWWPASAAAAMTGSAKDNPLKGSTGNVLEAFMDFYRS